MSATERGKAISRQLTASNGLHSPDLTPSSAPHQLQLLKDPQKAGSSRDHRLAYAHEDSNATFKAGMPIAPRQVSRPWKDSSTISSSISFSHFPTVDMARSNTWYTFGVAVFAAIGTFFFGFDTGIATTTIAHQSWIDYMGHPSKGLTGAVVAVYIAGEAVGALLQTAIGDRLGRIRFMQMMCIIVTIGVVIQTAAVNMGMFLAGRVLAGIAVGGMVGTVPIYLSEISAPHQRGLIGGISGCGISFGTMASNWIGFACGYAPYGAVQWRLPLGIQIPWGIIMFIGLLTFMPNSPRQLIRTGKIEQARIEFVRIRKDLHSHEAQEEFALMRAQIEYEQEREVKTYGEIFRLFRHRALASIAVQTMTSLTGVNVIQYYQTILYKSLGINSHTILALAGVYGTIAFLSNALTTRYLTDQWGRRKMILTGLSGTILIEIYAAVMQREFQNTSNDVGKGFAVLGIYLFVVCYYGMLNSTTWLYGESIRGLDSTLDIALLTFIFL